MAQRSQALLRASNLLTRNSEKNKQKINCNYLEEAINVIAEIKIPGFTVGLKLYFHTDGLAVQYHRMLSCGIIKPVTMYGSLILEWDSTNNMIRRMFRLQKRAARVILELE